MQYQFPSIKNHLKALYTVRSRPYRIIEKTQQILHEQALGNRGKNRKNLQQDHPSAGRPSALTDILYWFS